VKEEEQEEAQEEAKGLMTPIDGPIGSNITFVLAWAA